MKRHALTLAIVGFTMAVSTPAFACSTCFGAQDSPQTQGMNMAIFAMLGTTYTLFGAMLTTAFFLWRKTRRELQSSSSNEDTPPELAEGELSHG